MDKELSEKELENVIGSPLPNNQIPSKFKEVKKGAGELSEDDLTSVYGGPINVNDLPDDYYKDNKSEITPTSKSL